MFDTWKQYVGLHCNGYTATPISDYINNLVFQELLLERDYFRKDSDETVDLDLQDSLGYTEEIEERSEMIQN